MMPPVDKCFLALSRVGRFVYWVSNPPFWSVKGVWGDGSGLLHRNEDLNPIPSIHIKTILVLKRRDRQIPGTH